MNVKLIKFEVAKEFTYDHLWKRINGKKALLISSYQKGEIIRLSPKRIQEYNAFIEKGYLVKVS